MEGGKVRRIRAARTGAAPLAPGDRWAWQDAAECRDEPITLCCGPPGERAPEREVRERKAAEICATCPVRPECLDYAIARPEKYGTWGGLGEEDRASERRRRMRRTGRRAA